MLKKLLFFIFTLGLWAEGVKIVTADIELDTYVELKAEGFSFLGKTGYTHKKLLSCSPAIDVVYMLSSAKKLKLIPRRPWQSGTQYECDLGKELSQENRHFSFVTQPFRLKEYHYFEKEKLLRLVFNDKVDMHSLKANMTLYKSNALAKTALQYGLSSLNGSEVLVKIKEDVGENLSLHLKEKLLNIHTRKLAKSYVKKLEQKPKEDIVLSKKTKAMKLFDAPRMVSREDGSYAIRIFFDDTFYEEPVKKFIHIDGIEHFSLEKDVYLNEEAKEEFNIKGSYYYVDVLSDEFKPHTSYKMTLFKGLYHYRELKEDKHFTFVTADRKKHIAFSDSKNYVSNLGELGFKSVNVGEATVVVERITHDNYRYFINYTHAKSEEMSKYTHEVFSQKITLNNPKNILEKQKIRFKDLDKKLKYGVYKVTIAYEDKDYQGKTEHKTASKVIFVSDIGMSLKLSENQVFVSLLSLSSTKPLLGAEVEIYSKNNIRIAHAKSDKDGIVRIDRKGIIAKEAQAMIVHYQEDKNFLLLDKPVNDLSYKGLKRIDERYKAFIYFQSDILRPNSRIHALITLKDRDFISASSLPVRINLSMIESEELLLDKVYHSDNFGLIDFEYMLQNHHKTGAYRLEVFLGDKRIGKKRIDIESFMPPQIENTIDTDKEIYGFDDFMEVNISSSYLFGSPASYLSGKMTYRAMAEDYVNSKYKDYRFTNAHLEAKNEAFYINQTQNITLSNKGKTRLLLPCKSTQAVPSILKVLLGATIMDDTQAVSKYKELLIYPYKHLVGVHLKQKLIDKNTALEGRAVLLDPMTGEEIDQALSVIIKKVHWHYAYRDGRYHWESEISELDQFSIHSNQDFSRKIAENGEFIIEVHDRLGGHSASFDFEVSGWGYSNISPKNNLKSVEIHFEDKLYSKGDVLKASFKSPILEGSLLLILEGKKVYWHKRIALKKGVAQIDIPLNIALKRGVYIHAIAVRNTDSKANIIPFRAMGYAFVKPNRNAHKIAISLDYNQTTASKKSLSLAIETSEDTALLVSVVDKGILNITEQEAPKIFEYFNEKPRKELLYFDLYDEVMAYLTQGNLIAFGSDSDEALAKRKKHLAPDNSDRVKPFMLWSKIIHTKDKKALVNLDIPDFNGEGRIVVIAINKNSLAVKSAKLIVKDDIIIKPSYPRFLLKGDKVQVPIRIFNTSKTSKVFALKSLVDQGLSLDFKKESLSIPAKGSVVVMATLSALKEGKSKIKLFGNLGDKSFSKSLSLLVMTPYALQSYSVQGATSQSKNIKIPKQFVGGKVLLSLSDNPIGQLRASLQYLVAYPYGCAEQTSSKIAAMFYAKPFMRKDKLLGTADNFIRQGIKKLSALQNWQGEFAYWTEGGYVNPYASLYASSTLLALDAGGYTLNKEVKKSLIEALKKIAKGKKLQANYSKSHRVFAGFILSEYNLLDMSTANLLYDKKLYENYYFSKYYMSAILQNMNQDALAKKVYASVKHISLKDIASSSNYKGYNHVDFSSQSKDMFLLLYMNSRYFGKNKADFDEAKRRFSKLYSTQEKALAFKAISAYLGTAVHEKMELSLKLNADTSSYRNSVVLSEKLLEENIGLTPYSGVVNYAIEAYKPLPHAIKNTLFSKKTMRIKREFINAKGQALDIANLEQGTRIYAKITVAYNESIKNVVISERIPACMEIVNTRISKAVIPFKNKNLHLDYKDIRDDRVLHFLQLKKQSKKQESRMVFYTPLRVNTMGECRLPAILIEAMYDSRAKDYAKESTKIIVRDKDAHDKYAKKHEKHKKLFAFSPKQIKAKVRDFYVLETKSLDARDFISYFAYPIENYFNNKNATKEAMLKNKDKYNREWYKKSYNILNIWITKTDKKAQRYTVKILFSYELESKDAQGLVGVTTHQLTLGNIHGELKILSLGVKE